MSWKSYFFPQAIVITGSPYNHLIRVNEEYGNLKLLVDGSRQSGAYIKKLWRKTFQAFGLCPEFHAHSILILGVGGGTVITLLHSLFPCAAIESVDIDPVILAIAKKYFLVDRIPRTTYHCMDAKEFIQKQKTKKIRYDLIIVDLFSGRLIPEFVSDDTFLRSLRSLLHQDGILFINYLRELEYRKKSEIVFHILQTVFGNVKDYQIAYNRFFYAKNS